MKALLQRIRQILRDRRVRRFFTRFVSTVAAIVVFVTTYALILPAITMESQAACGIEAHQHDDSCFEEVLTCGLEESDGHRHGDSCYTVMRDLVCETPEHQHGKTCYDENGELTCALAEHAHGEDCYEEHRELTCEIPESEGHHHDASCYEKVLTCDREVHVHSTACYHSDAEAGASSDHAAVAGTESAASAGAGTASTVTGASNASAGAEASSTGTAGETGRDAAENAGSTGSVNGAGGAAADGNTGNDASTAATTNVLPDQIEESLSDGYVPQLDPVDMEAVFTKNTGFYYYDASAAAEDGQEVPADSSAITDWKKYKDGNVLEAADILRLYLPYTIPAGTLNSTNQVARYRLPGNIRLDDAQIAAINEMENGVAGSYVNYDTLEITDADKYEYYRGAEAVEGTRTPDQNVNDYLYDLVKRGGSGEEYISAVVKAENIFDEKTGDWLGQDLIFIFTPYTIEKNQNEYDTAGKPAKAGEKITGWFACDFNMTQVEWIPSSTDDAENGENGENGQSKQTAEVVFVEKDKEAGIKEISEKLTLVDQDGAENSATDAAEEAEENAAEADTENAAESSTEDAAAATTEDGQTAEKEAGNSSAGETAETATANGTADAAEEENKEETKEAGEQYKAGTLKASGSDYTITLEYTADACIPENAKLKVAEITAESDPEAYEACLEQARASVSEKNNDNKTTVDETASRFFDIEIVVTDENGETRKIEPKAAVSVNIQLEKPAEKTKDAESKPDASGDPAVLHFAEDGVENIENVDSRENSKNTATDIQFEAESFSIYGVVYTVDFHWEVDGKSYDFGMPGGGFICFQDLVRVLGIIDESNSGNDSESSTIENTAEAFVSNVETVVFSNPAKLSVYKVDEDTTVGAFKENHGLNCVYSDDLAQDQIDDINSQTLYAGDWVLISLAPFDSEETLTVTMKNGEVFTVQVTDGAIIVGKETDPSIGHVLYYQDGSTYYVLKTDGTTVTVSSTEEMDALSTEYQWTVTYVYVEDGIERYNIRPYTDKTTSLALNHPNQLLIGNGPNNITVVPTSEGANTYVFGGYNNTHLKLHDGKFTGIDDGSSTPVQIYNLEPLHQYSFTVQTNNSSMGMVSGWDSSGAPKTNTERFTTVSNRVNNTSAAKTNKYAITAVPDTTVTGKDGNSKYIFDHWEFNGKVLYQGANGTAVTEYSGTEPAKYTNTTINAGKFTIPENAGTLTAVFKQDENYKAKDEDKQGTQFNDMDSWLQSLIATNTPINEAGTNKTAEVYDYENRIYRVDLTAQSSLRTFNGNLDLGFVLDVSGSMKFPSKLVEDTTQGVRNIWQINDASPNANWHEVEDGYWDWNGWHRTGSHWEADRFIWQDWGLDTGKYYYVIAETDTRSTVFRLYYDTNEKAWRRVDSSYEDSSDSARTINSGTVFGVDNSENTSGYQIYLDGDYPYKRKDYEQASLTNTISSLNKLVTALTIVKETSQNPGADNPDARIAWNTFCANIDKWHPSFTSVTSNETIISDSDYAYDGGTRTDLALGKRDEGIYRVDGNGNVTKYVPVHEYGAYNFEWDTNNKSNYVILITDGAPQYGQGQSGPSQKTGKEKLKDDTDTLVAEVKSNIDDLREDKNAKIITVGLSMDDVEQGRKMLYDIADTVNGERMFYSAESGDQLEDILLHIIDTIMVDATVVGNVTDTIGEAFYPVDLATGRALVNNDEIDLNGNCVTGSTSYIGPRGKIIKDGEIYKVEWNSQDIPNTGWHGTVYVKAKEDFLGGNAVVTNNDLAGKAKVTATDYKLPGDNKTYKLADKSYILDENGNRIENTKYKLTKDMSTPRVNVNELYIGERHTAWTVYLGTEVDPKEQIISLYNNIPVEETVKKGGAVDTNGDNLPDILLPSGNQNNYNFTKEESISDQRPKIEEVPETFFFKDLIKSLANPGGSSEWWDYGEETLNWDELIRMANLSNQDDNTGFIIKYNRYGMRDEGFLQIKLKKEVAEGERGIDESPHATTVVGKNVEKYTLEVLYEPDYTTPPEGQGGTPDNAKEYKTGGYGTAYQGHAAGKEDRNNTHVINVYAKPLDVQKLDNKNKTLPGAKFALYRVAKPGETPVESDLTKYDKALTGDYVKISEGVSGTDGIAHLANTGNTSRTRLAAGETYYLIETEVPDGYERESAYRIVTAEVDENGTYTDLKNQSMEEKIYPFNWEQGARIRVDDSVVPLDGSGNEVSMAGRQYLKEDEVAVFRTKVFNIPKNISLEVEKKWTDKNDNPLTDHPDEIEFKLYRVSHRTCNHNWVVTAATCEADGSRTCTVCGETETIPATGHAWGEWMIIEQATYSKEGTKQRVCANDPSHIETEKYSIQGHAHVYGDWIISTPATCEGNGVMSRYCNICLEPDPNTQTIPALGHDYKMTSQKPATCTENGSRTFTCSHDSGHTYTETIPATGHDYGEWVVTTPATTSAPGVETRVCANDPTHIETREIPMLEDDTTTVTFNVNKRIDGEYYNVDYKTVSVAYPVGTRLRLEWTYPNGHYAPNAWFKKNATRLFLSTYGDKGCYILTGARLPYVEIDTPKVDGTVSTYSFEVDVSENLVIDICLENSWDKAIPIPSITVVREVQQTANTSSVRRQTASVPKQNAVLKRSAALTSMPSELETAATLPDVQTLAENAGPLGAGDTTGAEVLTAEQLKALLELYKTPEEAAGQYNVDIIEEITPAYTVTAEDGWKKTVDELPRHDGDGNEYTYYVVETSPSTGYITTYSGESSGLKDGDKVTITNKRVEVTIEIHKKIAGTSTPLSGAAFTLTQVDENGNNIVGGIVKGPIETGDDGKIIFEKIVPGRYKLEEIPPAGYIIKEGPYFINVTADGRDSVEGTVTYAEAEGHVFTIENITGAALPHTGGPGTTLIYLLGGVLTGIGLLLLLVGKRESSIRR